MIQNGHDQKGVGVAGPDPLLDDRTIIEEDEGGPRSPEQPATGSKGKQAGSRKKVGVALICLLLLTGVIAAAFLSASRGNKKVQDVNVPGRSQQPAANSPDTEAQISSLGQKLNTNAPVVQPSPLVQSVGQLPQQQAVTSTTPDATSLPVTSTYPGAEGVSNSVAGTTVQGSPQTTAAQQTGGRPAQPAQQPRTAPLSQIDSSPASQTSTYFFGTPPANPTARGDGQTAASPALAAQPSVAAASPAAPVVPPFGASLPVRTLGAIYSLRRDGYVRMETTRMVKGEGWSLPRGTQLVGRMTGTQNNRVFINLVGYIVGGKLVRVGGEVKGVDGGDGLEGSRRRVGNRFLRAVREVGNAGLQTFNSWLAGRSGNTQIYLPSGSIRDAQDGYNLQSATEYVAVKAGALGSVMITDLPEEVKGAPASDAQDAPESNAASALSDGEVIELLTGGTPEQIRAALPRMPAQVRPLAEAAINAK